MRVEFEVGFDDSRSIVEISSFGGSSSLVEWNLSEDGGTVVLGEQPNNSTADATATATGTTTRCLFIVIEKV